MQSYRDQCFPTALLLWFMQSEFGLSRCIFKKCSMIGVVCDFYSFCKKSCFFFPENFFLFYFGGKWYRRIINSAKVSPCKSPAIMPKNSLSSWFFCFLKHPHTASLEKPYSNSICSIFSLSLESNAGEKYMNTCVVSRFLARTPSLIQLTVWMCQVMDQFLRKPFWFYTIIFSIFGLIHLRSKAF